MRSTQEANKETLRRLMDSLNSRDPQRISATVDEMFRADAIIRIPLPVPASGAELIKQLWTVLLQAFPDLHVTIEDVVAEGDRVVCRNTVTGTHQGEYLGVAATGRQIKWSEIFIGRVLDGQVTETWGVVDIAGQMRQLDLIPGLPPNGRETGTSSDAVNQQAPDIGRIADRVAIDALRAECTDATVMKDADRLAALFTDDAIVRVPDLNVEWQGQDAIRDGFSEVMDGVETLVQNSHPGSIDVDDTTATGRTFVYESVQRNGTTVGNYAIFHDQYRRTGDGWKFSERNYEVQAYRSE